MGQSDWEIGGVIFFEKKSVLPGFPENSGNFTEIPDILEMFDHSKQKSADPLLEGVTACGMYYYSSSDSSDCHAASPPYLPGKKTQTSDAGGGNWGGGGVRCSRGFRSPAGWILTDPGPQICLHFKSFNWNDCKPGGSVSKIT